MNVFEQNPGAFRAKDPTWNAVREEDMTDEDSESGMPLDRPDKPGAPTMLPPELMIEWAARRKAEKKNNDGNNTNSDSEAPESEYPSPAEVAAALKDPPQVQSTEATEAEAEPAEPAKSSGVPANRKR